VGNRIKSLADVYEWLKKMCGEAGFGLLNIWSFLKSDKKGMKGLRCVCDKYGLNRKDLNPDSIINYAHLKLAIPEIDQCIMNTNYGRTHSKKFNENWEALKTLSAKNRPYGPTPDREIATISEGYRDDCNVEGCKLQDALELLKYAIAKCAYSTDLGEVSEGIKGYYDARRQIMDEIKKISERGLLYYVYPMGGYKEFGPIIDELNMTIGHLCNLDPILTTNKQTDLIISLEAFKDCIEKEKIKIRVSPDKNK